MSLITYRSIISCSSQDEIYCAENLLRPERCKKWLSSKRASERITCTIEFEKPSCISTVEIANDGSTFIELLVSQSQSDDPNDWTILLPSTAFMTANDARLNINRNYITTFKSVRLNEQSLNKPWIRLKIQCQQKFNRSYQYGITYIKLYSPTAKDMSRMGFFEKFYANLQNTNDTTTTDNQTENNVKSKIEIENVRSLTMKGVEFTLSDIPAHVKLLLREKATSMGAIYHEELNEQCTHFICSSSDSPGFNEVQQIGKCRIVHQQWIIDCYQRNQFLPEKFYQIKQTETKKKKNSNDEKQKKLRRGELPDFFHGKRFYVSYGDYDNNTLLSVTRIVLAYDGTLEQQITSNVTHVITNRMWNADFERISKQHPTIKFVNLDWLQDCHDENKLASIEPYLVVPY